jgi:hypothetical protein
MMIQLQGIFRDIRADSMGAAPTSRPLHECALVGVPFVPACSGTPQAVDLWLGFTNFDASHTASTADNPTNCNITSLAQPPIGAYTFISPQ